MTERGGAGHSFTATAERGGAGYSTPITIGRVRGRL